VGIEKKESEFLQKERRGNALLLRKRGGVLENEGFWRATYVTLPASVGGRGGRYYSQLQKGKRRCVVDPPG